MAKYKHVLVSIDLSETTPKLVKRVKALVDSLGSKLSLVHTIEPIPAYGYLGTTDLESPHIDEAKEALAKIGKELSVDEKNQYVEIGPTKAKILSLAIEIDADLIVVGSHGRSGISVLLGSTANAILHSASCDVLTVRLS